MCGIAGFVQQTRFTGCWESVLTAMSDRLIHRGPDSSGIWFDREAGIGLAQRRLSIIDLSPEGHQPMVSASGRFVIVFNGEIYNFRRLRSRLIAHGHRFRGYSDTEILLASIEEWGIGGAVARFNGMFAFALWDRNTRNLYLVRDRLGEKPLYYGQVGNAFIFASELKAFKPHPQWNGEIDPVALAMFISSKYIAAPFSIFRGISKLLPGTILTVDCSHPEIAIAEEPYWSLTTVAQHGEVAALTRSTDEMIYELEHLLLSSIEQRMIADVPLGAFLSGGVDSSTVVALMQSVSARAVKTFSVGFEYDEFDEAGFAREIADRLGTEHTELYVTADQAMSIIPDLPAIYDEPFADVSQIPTYLISKLARRHVTVSLSGDAGDELFCGYPRYSYVNDMWKRRAWLPNRLRQHIAESLTRASVEQLDKRFKYFGPLLMLYGGPHDVGDKIKKMALLLQTNDSEQFYRLLTSNWTDVTSLLNGFIHSSGQLSFNAPIRSSAAKGFLPQMMYIDTLDYLPNDILVKVDRAAMANSLESRIPFLDHRVVEFAWRLPLSVKLREGRGKWILRQVLSKYIPEKLFERPKKGFSVPIGEWLIGSLRGWAEELLSDYRLREEGYLNARLVRKRWSEHLEGRRNWGAHLWTILMFQAWLEHQRQTR